MKVAIVSPTTWQFVEKMASLFPEGITVAGPLQDDRHYWNDYNRKMPEWNALGLRVTLDLRSYGDIDFSTFDVAIHTIESFAMAEDWARHCTRIECPIVIKACWTRDPRAVAPARYIVATRHYPVLLEMPAHAPLWRDAGFTDVNVIFNPVGDWWFAKPWAGDEERALMVLSGHKSWRPDPNFFGLEIWAELERHFPGKMHLHDGAEHYLTSPEMVEMYRRSRVFVNLDRPFHQGERPLTLAFTEALSAGLPVVARNLPGLNFRDLIDGNGVCTNDIGEMKAFIGLCLEDHAFAKACGERSREIAVANFSLAALQHKYQELIAQASDVFRRPRGRWRIPFLRRWLGPPQTAKQRRLNGAV